MKEEDDETIRVFVGLCNSTMRVYENGTLKGGFLIYENLIGAGQLKTAAYKNLIAAGHIKPQHLIFFFPNFLCYLMLRLLKTAANVMQQTYFFTSDGRCFPL